MEFLRKTILLFPFLLGAQEFSQLEIRWVGLDSNTSILKNNNFPVPNTTLVVWTSNGPNTSYSLILEIEFRDGSKDSIGVSMRHVSPMKYAGTMVQLSDPNKKAADIKAVRSIVTKEAIQGVLIQ